MGFVNVTALFRPARGGTSLKMNIESVPFSGIAAAEVVSAFVSILLSVGTAVLLAPVRVA